MKVVRFNSVFADSMNRFLQLRAAALKERTVAINGRQLKSFDDYLSTNDCHSITNHCNHLKYVKWLHHTKPKTVVLYIFVYIFILM